MSIMINSFDHYRYQSNEDFENQVICYGSASYTVDKFGFHEKMKKERKILLKNDAAKIEKECDVLRLAAARKRRLLTRAYAMFNTSQGQRYMNFLTITFPREITNEQREILMNTLLTRIRKRRGSVLYLWVKEEHKGALSKGLYHYHLFIGCYINIKLLFEAFKESCINLTGYSPAAKAFELVTIQKKDKHKLTNYIAKYIIKSDLHLSGRSWGCSQSVSQLFSSVIIVDEDANLLDCHRFESKCGDFNVVMYYKKYNERFSFNEKLCRINDYVLDFLYHKYLLKKKKE